MHHSSIIAKEHGSMLDRLRAARETVARLVVEDAVYAPIFARLESEIAIEEARDDPVARARAIAAQLRNIK